MPRLDVNNPPGFLPSSCLQVDEIMLDKQASLNVPSSKPMYIEKSNNIGFLIV